MTSLTLIFANENVAGAFATHMAGYPKVSVTKTTVRASAVQIVSDESLQIVLDVLDAVHAPGLIVAAQS